MAGKKTETAYYIQKDWKLSPEVWGSFLKTFFIGVVAGAILVLWAGCSDVAKDMKANVPCKAPASSAPAQP